MKRAGWISRAFCSTPTRSRKADGSYSRTSKEEFQSDCYSCGVQRLDKSFLKPFVLLFVLGISMVQETRYFTCKETQVMLGFLTSNHFSKRCFLDGSDVKMDI